MEKLLSHREPMDMPDPYFPIKLHRCRVQECGVTAFPHHWHEQMEFLFMVRGTAMIECNEQALQVGPGDLVVVNSTDLHHGVSLSDDLFYFAIIADLSLLHSQSVDALETKYITPMTQNQILFQHKISGNAEVNACVEALIHEYEQREFGYELAVKSYLYRLLVMLLRSYIARLLTPDEYRLRRRSLERFDPVYRYIEENYASPIQVEALAERVGLSRYHFSRLFKTLTNKTVSEYINFVRLRRSEQLLRHTSMSVSEIALATGFNDVYYFSRLFKACKSVSPSELRKRLAESE